MCSAADCQDGLEGTDRMVNPYIYNERIEVHKKPWETTAVVGEHMIHVDQTGRAIHEVTTCGECSCAAVVETSIVVVELKVIPGTNMGCRDVDVDEQPILHGGADENARHET